MKMRLQTKIIIFSSLLLTAFLNAEVLLHVDFNNHTAGQHYNMAMARADFPHSGYTWYSNNLDVPGRGTIVQGREGAGNALRLLYPAGEIGSASTVQIRAALKKAVDTAWASYWVKFEDDEGGFDFVRGGKLPGLCGNQCITGGNDANGYNGWSARIMWRPEGVATQYMYYVTNQGYGEDLVFDKSRPVKRFIPGKWHRVNTQIIMNTPGAADGVIRSWFDGELAMEENNILIRHIDTLKINLFYISTFFGGSDLSWAPSKDTYITFDDFLIVTNPDSSHEPQLLYELSAINGRVPFHIEADLSASMNVGPNMFHVNFGQGVTAQISGMTATGQYTVPGMYNFRAAVWNSATENAERLYMNRPIFALGERDLLTTNQWTRMALDTTLRSGDTLRMYLTIVDTEARILVGPANTSNPGELTQPQEALFVGMLQYENGIFSAGDGSNYVAAPGTFGAGTYELEFVFHGTATSINAYTLSVYDTKGDLIHNWEDLTRRGSAQSGLISNYATWARRDRDRPTNDRPPIAAAVVHMEPFAEMEDDGNTSITGTTSKAVRQNRHSPIAAGRKNGISISIPAVLPPAQIEIFNAKGALVKRVSTDGKTARLFVPVKSRGLYLYRMKAGNNFFSGTVIVR